MNKKLLTAIPLATLSFGLSSAVQAAEQVKLGEIVVEGKQESKPSADTPYTSPSTSITAEEVEGLNAATIDDFIKYEPNLVVRRRYIGDPNATLGMRGSSMFQTTRSMVYADGLPLHYLLQSRYSGAPRWSLASPDETESVEVIYGPYSAEYSGNAMGGVVNINTKLPTKFTFNAEASIFSQDFQYLGTNDTFTGHREYASVGDRFGNLSVYLFHNHLENESQPMSYRYGSTSTANGSETTVTGGYTGTDASGNDVVYYGDSGIEQVTTDLTKLKLGYEMGDWLTRFTMAYEDRDRETNSPTNYLTDSSGSPVWSGDADFNGDAFSISSSNFRVSEQNRETLLLGVGLEGPLGNGDWTLETNLSHFDVLEDVTLRSDKNPADPSYTDDGRVTEYDDTGWLTLDVKARTDNFLNDKDMNFVTGYHYDNYSLAINSYDSTDYAAGLKGDQLSSSGGDTSTHAVFGQWGWQFKPQWDVALGARYERWTTKNGINYDLSDDDPATNLDIATRTETGFSPKLSFGYDPASKWKYRYSLAKAYRFPIVEELYHNEEKANETIVADEKLKPEEGIHQNMMFERELAKGFMRVNLFHEIVENVIFNQKITYSNGDEVSSFLPIDEVTTQGVEFILQQDRLLDDKLDARFNVTYLDSEVTKHSTNTSVEGNSFPRMPEWRANLFLTYHMNPDWDTSAGLRYASDSYGNLDNSDNVDNVFGAQDEYLFLDLKANYQMTKSAKLALGIDNVTDETAFVFHPWPQRTYYLEASMSL